MGIYLDNASTTKIDPVVLDSMMPYLNEEYGNAGSIHAMGMTSADAVRTARCQVSNLMNCDLDHIIFTSGGSESNSAVFKGVCRSLLEKNKRHLIVSEIEHVSVLKSAEYLCKLGFYVTYVKPDANGCITPTDIEKAIQPNTGLISVMCVNNETGVENDICSIGEICKRKSVLFHTDCVQAAGHVAIDPDKFNADFISISSHKIHGPKGVGALYIRNRNFFESLVCGGADQEYGLRGGTENVPGIVGFGTACEIALNSLEDHSIVHVNDMKYEFWTSLLEEMKKNNCQTYIQINGNPSKSIGKVLNIRISGIDSETLIIMLNSKGIFASAGSACRSHESLPSHVLTAMGLSEDEAKSSIRISFSKFNTDSEVIRAARELALCVKELRYLTYS